MYYNTITWFRVEKGLNLITHLINFEIVFDIKPPISAYSKSS
ncbi:Hypothetical protein BN2458_PEG1288 [Helicobacter typhlonius]|uniref:Uncharacterized protein n=1 Tax=Helicobacter typhlonius TaxID=76936 RepID=A0A0S4PVC2_9HELI|nr:Hypothetical protein BN2458_PEG1288 [Helicobacter typhlonius]